MHIYFRSFSGKESQEWAVRDSNGEVFVEAELMVKCLPFNYFDEFQITALL